MVDDGRNGVLAPAAPAHIALFHVVLAPVLSRLHSQHSHAPNLSQYCWRTLRWGGSEIGKEVENIDFLFH